MTTDAGRRTITGEIRFQPELRLPGQAVARVTLIDATYEDAPSEVIAQLTLTALSHSPIPFSLHVPPLNPRRRYRLTAHVSLTGSIDVRPGDNMTTQSYPVTSETDRLILQLTPAL